MTTRIVLALLVALPMALPAQAGGPIAEVICAPRDQMLARLQQGMGAELAGQGLRTEEAVIEVWADARGDWTLVQTWTDGKSCILAMGEGWEGFSAPPPA